MFAVNEAYVIFDNARVKVKECKSEAHNGDCKKKKKLNFRPPLRHNGQGEVSSIQLILIQKTFRQ